ncbi:hypothetical protein D9619_009923 [Psilocybe cf. subviscida]|uniref:Uncharacterized protein n=1 Tax=Psilocybe cf. subviscida TaxID=2480587 RepID=A0A8H5BMX4_9AGAR|nr:hypothetical protein D9619_009923 [Psilocybe cf. subviscida]
MYTSMNICLAASFSKETSAQSIALWSIDRRPLQLDASPAEVILGLFFTAHRNGKPAQHIRVTYWVYNPADWDINEEHPYGVELTIENTKTGYCTVYTPPGMTTKEILAIPAAQRFWDGEEAVN